MKKRIMAVFVLCISVLLTGCAQTNDADYCAMDTERAGFHISPTPAPNTPRYGGAPSASRVGLSFDSLEEFLQAHSQAREGHAASRLIEADRLSLASIETLYLPSLPDEYHIIGIQVREHWIDMVFWAGDATDPDAMLYANYNFEFFRLQASRWTCADLEEWGMNSPQETILMPFNLTEADLLRGTHHFFEEENTLFWMQGNTRLALTVPGLPPALSQGAIAAFGDNIVGFQGNAVYDLLSFTDIMAIDLWDADALSALNLN
jgi:hypothetical protein